jgi:hypothetical protein
MTYESQLKVSRLLNEFLPNAMSSPHGKLMSSQRLFVPRSYRTFLLYKAASASLALPSSFISPSLVSMLNP